MNRPSSIRYSIIPKRVQIKLVYILYLYKSEQNHRMIREPFQRWLEEPEGKSELSSASWIGRLLQAQAISSSGLGLSVKKRCKIQPVHWSATAVNSQCKPNQTSESNKSAFWIALPSLICQSWKWIFSFCPFLTKMQKTDFLLCLHTIYLYHLYLLLHSMCG